MDVMIYSFVIPSLIALWHITTGQAGLLGTSTLILSALGGWMAGLAADRYGRVRILQISIAWFAVFTFLSGFTHSFYQLLAARSLQGLGFGGEWAVGSVLMGEAIRPQHRGRAVGTVQSGWAIGWAMATLSYVAFFSWLPIDFAWRAMFWIGILPALLVLYIRKHVPEPQVFLRVQRANGQTSGVSREKHWRLGGRGKAGDRLRIPQTARNARQSPGLQVNSKTAPFSVRQTNSWLAIFRPGLLRTTALCSLLSLGAQGGYYAIMTWLPLFLKNSRRLSLLDAGGHLAVVIGGAFAGYLVSADLTDRMGRRPTLILFALGALLTVWSYALLPISASAVFLLGFPLGFFSSGSFSPLGSLFTELFPTSVRASGQGFVYNLGRAVGALFPALVGYASARLSLGHAIAAFALGAYALMALGAFLLPETRRAVLS